MWEVLSMCQQDYDFRYYWYSRCQSVYCSWVIKIFIKNRNCKILLIDWVTNFLTLKTVLGNGGQQFSMFLVGKPRRTKNLKRFALQFYFKFLQKTQKLKNSFTPTLDQFMLGTKCYINSSRNMLKSWIHAWPLTMLLV